MVIPDLKVDYPRVTHPCATLLAPASKSFLVRLACVKHAASVHSEPESNSPVKFFKSVFFMCFTAHQTSFYLFNSLTSFQRSNALCFTQFQLFKTNNLIRTCLPSMVSPSQEDPVRLHELSILVKPFFKIMFFIYPPRADRDYDPIPSSAPSPGAVSLHKSNSAPGIQWRHAV